MTMTSTSRHSMDSLSPISPHTSRGEYYSRLGSHGIFQRRESTTSSINSIGGILDTSSHSHGLAELGHNAISTLLQPPIVRTGSVPHTSAPASSAHRPPTARDIPPVTLTKIPKIDPAEFRSYLTQVGALYESLQRAKANEEEGGTQFLKNASKGDGLADLMDQGTRSSITPNISRQSSLPSLALPIETQPSRGKWSGNRRMAHARTPLTTIPTVYFEEDFHLENPRTFDVVSERSEVVKPAPGTVGEQKSLNENAGAPRKALATNAILQEKLSWYMDTIEIHLIQSISTASTSFFAALGSLRDLHSQASASVDRIKSLRKELQFLDEKMAISGMNLVTLKQRRENLKQLSDAVLQLKRIVEGVTACESLVDNGDLDKALDTIEEVEKLIHGEENNSKAKRRTRDLSEVTALQGVTNNLDTLRFRIGKVFENRFLSTLMGDLRGHVDSVSALDTLQRWSAASQRSRSSSHRDQLFSPSYLMITDDFRADLSANISGLHRARHAPLATTAYRDAVLREFRNIVRRQLPASNEDDTDSVMSNFTVGGGRPKTQQEKSTILARNLRALEPDDAEELLKKVYIGVGETLRRLGTQVKVLLDVTSTLGGPSPVKSPPRSPHNGAIDERLNQSWSKNVSSREVQEEMHIALDTSNLLGQAVDIAQDKIVKVLRVRSEQSTHLSVENFLRYFTLNLLFANECEAVSGRSGTSLKNIVNSQIKEFTQQLGESQRQSLATGMEADSWNAKDFSEVDNEILSRILSSSTQDIDAWTASGQIWLLPSTAQPDQLPVQSKQTNGTSVTSTPSKTATRPAVIESESFILPKSAIQCLHGLASFLHLNTGLPSMASEIAASILSYLSLFNSRCTQLILGAGATRSAGLKNITTKHLALASQALAFILTLIPHIREFVRRHLSPSNSSLMCEFDKVRRAYLEHQQSIYDKLVNIMAGRATAHAKSMRSIDWGKETQGVNTYMETLTKETSTLHKVLSKHLPDITVGMIMRPVFGSYREQWSKAFGEVILGSEEAKERMLRDAEWFKNKIGALDNSGDVGDFIVNLVKDKMVPKSKAATENTVTDDKISPASQETLITSDETGKGTIVDKSREKDGEVIERKGIERDTHTS